MNKHTILLITSRPDQLQELVEEIRRDPEAGLMVAVSAQDALTIVGQRGPALVVVDDRVGDMTGLELVRHLIQANAFVHTAVLSDATEEDFHRDSEGLGVLTRLPLQPGKEDARRLLERLRRVLG